MLFLQELRQLMKKYGSDNIVYFDESGFETETYRTHAWAERGKKVYGKICGNNRKRINLIMAQRGKEWLAPVLFKGACCTEMVNQWIQQMLLPELKKPSVIVMDNAGFHNKQQIQQILQKEGHTMLPLPTYSPDFNPIEKSFAIIKKRRMFSTNINALESILLGNL